MKVFCVTGVSGSGKTATIESVIRELKARKYSVGSVKEIHHGDFRLDSDGTNTDRHRKAGSETVTARGLYETDIMFPSRLPVGKILSFYHCDYVVLEGVEDVNAPKIITALSEGEIDERIDYRTFAISGVIAKRIAEYRGFPVISGVTDAGRLTDLIEEKVPELLPNLSSGCCGVCGLNCHALLGKILSGERKIEDCIAMRASVQLHINGHSVKMAPFVQRILRNAALGVVKELDGYEPHSRVEISIGTDDVH